ncbi:MAG: exodeoxyribonuclease III, partial [Rhodospirillaceae bacterium]
RLRLDHLQNFVTAQAPDVLCLQELKAKPDAVPGDAMAAMGFPHHAINSIPGYNGVAIFSRTPLVSTRSLDWCGREDGRHVIATLGTDFKGLEIHCLYVPAGGDEPDPEKNPKFAHKLAFLDALTDWCATEAIADAKPVLLCGDLNIAPLEDDVWSHKQLLKVVSHTPIEVDKLLALQEAGPWVDAMRARIPAPEKLFTWWSYRARDWRASNKGRRLDHIWLSNALAPALGEIQVVTEPRDWTKPSDHVPVAVDLDLSKVAA